MTRICARCGTPFETYATFSDVVMCKGRIGRAGSLHERFAFWIARLVTAAIMRDPQLRKELVIAISDAQDRFAKQKCKCS